MHEMASMCMILLVVIAWHTALADFASSCLALNESAIHTASGRCVEIQRMPTGNLTLTDYNDMCTFTLDGRLFVPRTIADQYFMYPIAFPSGGTDRLWPFVNLINTFEGTRDDRASRLIGWNILSADNDVLPWPVDADTLDAGDPRWYPNGSPNSASARCAKVHIQANYGKLTDAECDGSYLHGIACEYEPAEEPEAREGCQVMQLVRVAHDRAWRKEFASTHTVQSQAGIFTIGKCASLCAMYKRCHSMSINEATGDCRLKRLRYVEGGVVAVHLEDVADRQIYNVHGPACT